MIFGYYYTTTFLMIRIKDVSLIAQKCPKRNVPNCPYFLSTITLHLTTVTLSGTSLSTVLLAPIFT